MKLLNRDYYKKAYRWFFQKNSSDDELMNEVANYLETPAFDLFWISYYKWNHGKNMHYDQIQSVYGKVMMKEAELPIWARSYFRLLQKAIERNDYEGLRKLLTIRDEESTNRD